MEKRELREKLENVLERVILGVSEELQGDYTETYNVYFSDVDTIKEEFLSKLEPFISQELDRAREEGRREVLEDMKKMWDNDNLGDAPKYGRAGAGLMKRWIRDDINERLSKLTTK